MDTKQLLEKVDAALAQLAIVRAILASDGDSVPSDVRRVMDEERKNGICHFCKKPLGNRKPVRECHPSCVKSASRMVERGQVSESELLSTGRLGPPAPPGRKPRQAVQDILASQADATAQADAAARRGSQKQTKRDDSRS